VDELTPRQREILALLAELSNKQVARRLGISPSTLRNHLGRMYRRLGVTDRTAAVVLAKMSKMSNSEIARKVNMTPQTVKQAIDRACGRE
jgi:DNA-binding CsgD family transcriptional regulator